MEFITLGLFCGTLLLCVVLNWSILYALVAGLIIFLLYGKKKGYTWNELAKISFASVKTVRNILITFILIGMLTALWREAGTIPVIVCYATQLIRPSIFLMMVFLLNCAISVLTGTAFGTAATMGVICATMAATMNVDLLLVGGAVLSGVFFGDRCSPVSTSALLISELTKTNIFKNIKGMIRTAMVPFLVTCLIYLLIGFFSAGAGETPDLRLVFGREFNLSWVAILPAVVILGLSLLQVNVKKAMTASILTAVPICLTIQGTPIPNLFKIILTGYHAQDAEVAAMLNGGGITSMLRVTAIVCLSSAYSGIFQKTGLLDSVKELIHTIAMKTNSYTATLCTSAVAGMIACNQTLAIMLTNQLCEDLETDQEKFALDLENTAVVVAAMVPWSIASGVPLASVGAPSSSILLAFFLYLLPAWRLILEARRKRYLQINPK